MPLKAIIIEDEKHCQEVLKNLLVQFCKNVIIVSIVDRINEAVTAIHRYQPDLVFLDVELPEENGFALFNYLPQPNFKVIFTSAHNHFASKAFKLSAIDYLLKPIDLSELKMALLSTQENRLRDANHQKFEVLKENLNAPYEKLALPTVDGFSFIKLQEVIYCKGEGNYTHFVLTENQTILVSKTLKRYEEILEDFTFVRIHKSHLININHVVKYGKQKSPTVTMSDGTILSVSPHYRQRFLDKFM